MKESNNRKILIKLGGSILENKQIVKNLCSDIQKINIQGLKIILVHGGGKFITKTLVDHGMSTNFVNGLRVTPKEHIQLIQMALYMVNKKISKMFSSIGLDGIGMSGEDSNLFSCNLIDKDKYGYVGLVKQVNSKAILAILSQGLIPIVSTIGTTDKFASVNVNADNAAAELGIVCGVDELVYLTDQDGVLDKKGNLIKSLTRQDIQKLIEDKTATEGMLIKLNSIKKFLTNSKKSISILNGNQEEILLDKFIKQGQNYGTTCTF